MSILTLAQDFSTSDVSANERILNRFMSSDMFGWCVFFGFVLLLVFVSKTASTIKAISRERTRREIAAFIAEGSITPEQGERLMKAGVPADQC